MARNLEIGGIVFKAKTHAKKHIQGIVARYRDGEQVKGNDLNFVLSLLEKHPEAEMKFGCGIISITVERNPVWRRNRGFMLHRQDGSSTDFSWISCLDGANPRRDVLGAMRHVVHEQVLAFKIGELARGAECPFRGLKLTKDNSHVDHIAPDTFDALASRWMEERGLDWRNVEITDGEDHQYVASMTDDSQRESWRSYHAENARLRLISAAANLSEAKA